MVTYESRPIGAPGKSPSGAFSSPSGNAHARFLPGRALEEGAPTRPGHSAAVYTASGMLSPFEGSAPVPVKQRSKAYGREAGGRGGTERAVAGHECSSSGRAAPAEGQGRAVGSPHGRHSTSIYGQQPARPLSGQLQQAGASFNRSGGAGRPSSREQPRSPGHRTSPGTIMTSGGATRHAGQHSPAHRSQFGGSSGASPVLRYGETPPASPSSHMRPQSPGGLGSEAHALDFAVASSLAEHRAPTWQSASPPPGADGVDGANPAARARPMSASPKQRGDGSTQGRPPSGWLTGASSPAGNESRGSERANGVAGPEASFSGGVEPSPISEEGSDTALEMMKSLSFVNSEPSIPEGWMEGEEAAEKEHRSRATLSAPGRRRLPPKSATATNGERAAASQRLPGRAASAQPRTRALFSSTKPGGDRRGGRPSAGSLVRSIPSTITAHGFVVPRKPVQSRDFPGGASDGGGPHTASLPYGLSHNRLIPYRASTVLSHLPGAEEMEPSHVFRDGRMVKAADSQRPARGFRQMSITGRKMLTQSWSLEDRDPRPAEVTSPSGQVTENVNSPKPAERSRQEMGAQSICVVSVVTREASGSRRDQAMGDDGGE
eukprot:jgi/Tetstr1/448837/TSEL_036063.t1